MTNDDEKLLASLTGFTPGPWVVDDGTRTAPIEVSKCLLAHFSKSDDEPKHRSANAALIAAAPSLFRIATEQAVENKRLCRNLAQVVDALGMALNVYDGAGLAPAEPVEATDAIDYCRMLFKFHNKAGKP